MNCASEVRNCWQRSHTITTGIISMPSFAAATSTAIGTCRFIDTRNFSRPIPKASIFGAHSESTPVPANSPGISHGEPTHSEK